jgi:hypothetical protein
LQNFSSSDKDLARMRWNIFIEGTVRWNLIAERHNVVIVLIEEFNLRSSSARASLMRFPSQSLREESRFFDDKAKKGLRPPLFDTMVNDIYCFSRSRGAFSFSFSSSFIKSH